MYIGPQEWWFKKKDRSLRFNSADSAYLSRTPASAGNRKTFTVSFWTKYTSKTISASGGYMFLTTGSSISTNFRIHQNGDIFQIDDNLSGMNLQLADKLRDPSAWYHFVIAIDTTQTTPADRAKVYKNGVLVTNFGNQTYPGPSSDTYCNAAADHEIGRETARDSFYFDGYLADFHFIDGQALAQTAFGEFDATTGVWNPIEYTGTYPGNSFHLDFANGSSLGTDVSGNNNTWASSGMGSEDQMKDSPTNGTASTGGDPGGSVVGNYCTWNPLLKGSSTTLSNGNLDMSSGNVWQSVVATIGVTSGKWYWEQTMTTNQYTYSGICNQKFLPNFNSLFPSQSVNSWAYLSSNGNAYYDQGGASAITVALTTMASGGGTLGFALDLDNQKLWFSLNGTWMGGGSPTAGTNAAFTNLTAGDTYFPCADVYSTSSSFNFGQKTFVYGAPAGYRSLNTANIEPPSILNGSKYFDVALYDGNNTGQSITGLNFSPDLIWYKRRNVSDSHIIEDVIRAASQRLNSDANNAQYDMAAAGFPTTVTFDSNGFTVGNNGSVNASGSTYVAWSWEAGHPNTATTGSVKLGGSGDYLLGGSTNQLRDAQYTIDAWIYISALPSAGAGMIFDTGSGGSDPEFYVYNNNGNLQLTESLANNVNWNGGAPYLSIGKWHYIKQTVDGTSSTDSAAVNRLYLDGQLGVQNTVNLSGRSSSSQFAIGSRTGGNISFAGYISNLRYRNIVDNSTTVPSGPLSSDANTKILCCQSTTSATTAALTPTSITANGDAAATAYNPLDAFSVNGTGYSTASAAGITQGTIPLTGASVNVNAGFSMVSYIGTGSAGSVPHALNAVPEFIIVKNLSATFNWGVGHASAGWNTAALLDLTNTFGASVYFNSTNPTSSVFSVGASSNTNGNGNNMVAYCFAPIEGYSSFGSWNNNNSASGTFVYLGFRPRYILLKNTDNVERWYIMDSARHAYNVPPADATKLTANTPDTEGVQLANTATIDFLSNGFKIRTTNTAGGEISFGTRNYVYAAFAENPFSLARAR